MQMWGDEIEEPPLTRSEWVGVASMATVLTAILGLLIFGIWFATRDDPVTTKAPLVEVYTEDDSFWHGTIDGIECIQSKTGLDCNWLAP